MKNLEKHKEVIGVLSGVFVARIWFIFPNLLLHVLLTIDLAMMLGVLSGVLYVISAQDKKAVKIYPLEQMVEDHKYIDKWNKEKDVVITMEHNIKN